MKKYLISAMIFIFAATVIAANGPDTINLAEHWVSGKVKKKEVIFPHAVHQKNNSCTDCHMTAEGGALKSGKGKELNLAGAIKGGKTSNAAHKEFCWDCHKKKKVKKGKSCSTCH